MAKNNILDNSLEKSDFEKGWSDLSSVSWSNNLYIEIWHALARLSEKKRRHADVVLAHYGLIDDLPMSYQSIAVRQNPLLSKETVRRYLKQIVFDIRKGEREGVLVPRPFERVRALFKESTGENGFFNLKQWLDLELFSDFRKNQMGLLKFLEDAGIAHCKIGSDIYCFSNTENRLHIHQMIKRSRRELSVARTSARLLKYKKIITFLPKDLIKEYKAYSLNQNRNIQRVYEEVLSLFMDKKPWRGFSGFFLDVKNVTYHGKYGDWEEILLYIDKEILDRTFAMAKTLDITPRAFICRALSWYSVAGYLDANVEINDN